MSTLMLGPTRRGTRWRRAALMAGLALGVVVTLAGLMRTHVLATSFIVQGSSAQFATSQVKGTDVGFGLTNVSTKASGGAVSSKPVLSAGFATGRLDGLCLSQTQSLGALGSFTIKVTAGDGDPATTEISAKNMQFDLTRLRGTGSGINLDGIVQLGLSAADVTTVSGVANPLEAPTGTGYWGIDASAGNIFNLRGTLWDAQIIGNASLPSFKLAVLPGTTQACDGEALPH